MDKIIKFLPSGLSLTGIVIYSFIVYIIMTAITTILVPYLEPLQEIEENVIKRII